MEQKFIEMAKVIFTSIDHYRESGRDDKFNIDSIAEYLQRQFLLQQTPCTTLLEELEQMMNKELKVRDDVSIDFEIRKQAAKDSWDFRRVIELIKERQPIA